MFAFGQLEDIRRRYLVDSMIKVEMWNRGYGRVLFLQWHDQEPTKSGEAASHVIRVQAEVLDIRVRITGAWFANPRRCRENIVAAVEAALPCGGPS